MFINPWVLAWLITGYVSSFAAILVFRRTGFGKRYELYGALFGPLLGPIITILLVLDLIKMRIRKNFTL